MRRGEGMARRADGERTGRRRRGARRGRARDPRPARSLRVAPLLVSLAVAGTAAGGCGDTAVPGDGTPTISERDSSGVRIVEVAGDPADLPVYATVPAEPERSLGALDGPPGTAFSSIADVREIPGGALLVADGGRRSLHLYDDAWRHRLSFGREGDGPGELRAITSIVAAGLDSVVVFDARAARLTTYDGAGDVLATTPVDRDVVGYPVEMRARPGGGFVVVDGRPGTRVEIAADFTLRRERLAAVRLDAEGRFVDTLAAVPGDEGALHSTTVPGSGGSFRVRQMALPLPFPRGGLLLPRPSGGVVGGSNDRFDLRWWDADGSLTRIVRWPAATRVLSAEVSEARERQLRSDVVGSVDDAAMRRTLDDLVSAIVQNVDAPDVVPAFSELHLDVEGRLWVSEYLPLAAAGEATRWRVFSPEGRPLGTVETPPGLEIVEIGRDRIFGVWRNDVDVPFLREHRIVREGGR